MKNVLKTQLISIAVSLLLISCPAFEMTVKFNSYLELDSLTEHINADGVQFTMVFKENVIPVIPADSGTAAPATIDIEGVKYPTDDDDIDIIERQIKGNTVTLSISQDSIAQDLSGVDTGDTLTVTVTIRPEVLKSDASDERTNRLITRSFTVNGPLLSSKKSITSFSFTAALNSQLTIADALGIIDDSDGTIHLQVSEDAFKPTSFIASFTSSNRASITVNTTPQESGTTSNDFSSPVAYTVTAEDGSTKDYEVSVATLASDQTPGKPLNPSGVPGSTTGTGIGEVTIRFYPPEMTGVDRSGVSGIITEYRLYYTHVTGSPQPGDAETTMEVLPFYPAVGSTTGPIEWTVKVTNGNDKNYFAVSAVNAAGEGRLSNHFRIITPHNDLDYTLIKDDTEYSVSGTRIPSGKLVIGIPEYYEGKRVTAISPGTFQGFSSLVDIHLPDGITSIGANAFDGCTNLALTSLPAELTSIGDDAFNGCTNLALTSLPAELTSIGDDAFNGCTSLALTSLPAGLTSIEERAFKGCTSLALTSLPDGISSIKKGAFNGCTSLALESLPAGLTSIGDYAFNGCENLALTSLPNGLKSIGNYAFKDCTSLTEITIKSTNPPEAGIDVFADCSPQLKIKVPAASEDTYKKADGWDTYARLIFSIEEAVSGSSSSHS